MREPQDPLESAGPWDAVVLGAGMGGLAAAVRLRRLASGQRRILVIDQAAWHTLRPKLPEAIGGACRCAVRLPLAELLSARRISFLQAEVRAIDPWSRQVSVRTDGAHDWTVRYGALIVALGSVPAPSPGPGGAAARALPLWSFEDACALRRRLGLLAARARRQGDAEALSVAVLGGGFVGVEVASAVARLTGALVAGTPLRPVTTLVEAQGGILPEQPPSFGRRVAAALRARGVRVISGHRAAHVGPDALLLDDGTRVPATTLVWTGGVRPHPALAGLGPTDPGGAVPVSTGLDVRDLGDVFVVGDAARLPGPHPPRPFDHSAAGAAAMGRHAAANLAARWRGRSERAFRLRPAPLLVELDARHVLGLTAGGRRLVRPAPLLKQVALARHVWSVGGWRTLRAVFGETFWEPWRRRTPETDCPPPAAQDAVPVLLGGPGDGAGH